MVFGRLCCNTHVSEYEFTDGGKPHDHGKEYASPDAGELFLQHDGESRRFSLENETREAALVQASLDTDGRAGILVYSDGSTYKGQWCESPDGPLQANGRGWYSDGQHSMIYEGEWKDNRPSGWGTQVWADGAKYVGNYKAGMRNGFGVLSADDGSCYKGQFVNDLMHGAGMQVISTLACPQGDGSRSDGDLNFRRYHGEFCFGRRHGQGCFETFDGRSAVGVWEHGTWLCWTHGSAIGMQDPLIRSLSNR